MQCVTHPKCNDLLERNHLKKEIFSEEIFSEEIFSKNFFKRNLHSKNLLYKSSQKINHADFDINKLVKIIQTQGVQNVNVLLKDLTLEIYSDIQKLMWRGLALVNVSTDHFIGLVSHKFVFSKKAIKIDKIFIVDLTLTT